MAENESIAPPTDIEIAKVQMDHAIRQFVEITRLPQNIGDRVIWDNAVIWTRVGPDDWQPSTLSEVAPQQRFRVWPSSHIVLSSGWKVLEG